MNDEWGSQPGRSGAHDEPAGTSTEWQNARKRVEKRRKFVSDVVAYVVINAFLVGIWALGDRGYFWPAWVLAGWGIGLLLSAWEVYGRKPISDADVQSELDRVHR